MLTLWCLSVAAVAPFLAGAPVAWLIRRGHPLRAGDWLWVPFAGVATVVCILQPLVVFADLPLRRTVPWFWVGLGALWLVALATRSGRASLGTVPVRTVLVMLAVYLALASELVRRGVDEYRGNLISDQYNYVTLAQFLIDVPYSTSWPQLNERPWAAIPISLKGDRLGQSVLHGFFAVTSGLDSLSLFFPTLFLAGGLLVPAVRLLAPRFGLFGRGAVLASAACGLVPGVAAIIGECYYSHALFIPFFLVFIAALLGSLRRTGWVPVVAVAGAGAFSVYTEFTPLLFGVTGVAALAARITGRATSRRAGGLVLALAAGIALAPAAVASAGVIADRAGGMGHQNGLRLSYIQLVSRVWLDEVRGQQPGPSLGGVAMIGFVAAGLALALLGWARLARGAARAGRSLVPALVAAAVLALPVVAACSPASRYAVYKLLMTASPLLMLGLVFCARAGAGAPVPVWARAGRIAAVVVAVLAVADTIHHQSSTRRRDLKQTSAEWNHPDVRQVVAALRTEPSADVVLALGDEPGGYVPAGALIYHARHHRVRIESPQAIWAERLDYFPAPQLHPLPAPPAGTLVVRRIGSGGTERVGAGEEEVVRTERFVLVRVGGASSDRAARTTRP